MTKIFDIGMWLTIPIIAVLTAVAIIVSKMHTT